LAYPQARPSGARNKKIYSVFHMRINVSMIILKKTFSIIFALIGVIFFYGFITVIPDQFKQPKSTSDIIPIVIALSLFVIIFFIPFLLSFILWKDIKFEKKGHILSALFFGHIGLDRFIYDGFIRGFLKLITFGGFGIWYIVDLVNITSTMRHKKVILYMTYIFNDT
jgi:hypothetical protein